jgi:LysM repeat protein
MPPIIKAVEETVKSHQWMLIVGLACLVCGVFLLDVWVLGAYVFGVRAESLAAADQPSATLAPRARQPLALPPAAPATATVTLIAPIQATAASAASLPTRYKVKAGDTLFSIALNYGLTLEALIQFNRLDNPDRIYPGQELVIPPEGVVIPTRPPVTRTPAPVAARALAAPAAAPVVPPAPGQVNGVPVGQIVALPDNVRQNIRKIYIQGQARGNMPNAFAKIGDSNMESPYFMGAFDRGTYDLGRYAYLEDTISYFLGSFGRSSPAVRIGFHSWSVLDAAQSNKSLCWPNETPLACEFRVQNPSLAFIRLSTNDAGHPQQVQQSLQAIVEACVQRGVVPMLGTKADRVEGADDAYNTLIRQIAARNAIPLWDFDRVAATLPDRGLGQDNIHLTVFYPLDYTLPRAFENGHSTDDLTALIVLDQVWRAATQK